MSLFNSLRKLTSGSRNDGDDMKMKFSLAPGTETGFSQWLDAMKMVAQLPGGVPCEFRTKLWLQLSERHLNEQNIDWEKAEAVIFNEWTNPDDEELGVQIVKDLHRTGCSLFCGAQEQNQALLKRVLLAYARWNKNVGYCQGFNMLAALILQVMDRDEKNAVKVMIYLIEGVLPESYFANNLRGLSVDMAVFRDLLRLRLPKLSKHLEALQNDTNSGTSYEPPLTNVFTMQWFLTLFSNCLPQQTVLRVWDLVFLHGNEVLLRTALAIWGILQDRIMSVESADEFYSIMGVVTREMLEFGLMDANNLIKMIVMVDPFPNELQELREKYLYNISPWTQSVQSAARKGIKLFYSDPEDQDDTEDEDKIALATAYGVFRRRESGSKEIQPMGPTLDISILKQQYAKLRQRQRQAHIIISAACSSNIPANLASVPTVSVNHLLMGKSALVNKGRRIGPPEGSIPPPKNRMEKAIDSNKQVPRKEKIVISGETLEWKDAEKRRCSIKGNKKISNTDNNITNNKINKSMESCNGLKRRSDDQQVGKDHLGEEESDENVAIQARIRRGSTSSGSSTSTELCDDENHRMSDFDADEANAAIGVNVKPNSESEPSPVPCGAERFEEIKKCATDLLTEIEEMLQGSERLRHLKDYTNPSMNNNNVKTEDVKQSHSTSIRDNTKKSPISGRENVDMEFLKSEPEVPIFGKNVIDNAENRIFDRSKVIADEDIMKNKRDRRKSDLALSVIKENLEMLNKFSQKSSVKEEIPERNADSYKLGEKVSQANEGKTGIKLESGTDKPPELETTEKSNEAIRTTRREAREDAEEKEDQKQPVGKENRKQITETESKGEGIKEREESKSEKKATVVTADPATEKQKEYIKLRDDDVEKKITEAEKVFETESRPESRVLEGAIEETEMKEIRSTVKEVTVKEEKADKEIMGERLEKRVVEGEVKEKIIRKEEDKADNGKTDLFGDHIRKGELQDTNQLVSSPKKVNKEVNTDITMSAVVEPGHNLSIMQKNQSITDDFLVSFMSNRSPERFKHDHFGREDLAERWKKESERIESKIELSKSDWDLKMKKIAELENTTREKLNEMKSKSIVHRHRSLDRFEGRASEKRRSPIPKIEVQEDEMEDMQKRKKKISALSFDEITSRTEKLLGTSLSLESSSRKWRKSFEEDAPTSSGRSYEFYSSPTSPEYRQRKYTEYSSPKRYDTKWKHATTGEDDWLTITEENGRSKSIELESSGRRSDKDYAMHLKSPNSFNPFPTRTLSRPKELGVRLGMYPTSPEGAQPSKKS